MRKPMTLAAALVALVCVCGAAVTRGGNQPAPAREKPTDEAWLPKPKVVKVGEPEPKSLFPDDPPSAFPDLAMPKRDPKDTREQAFEKYTAAFEKLCPRITGVVALKIEAGDDTRRKLLKARLHQGLLEFRPHLQPQGLDCFNDKEQDLARLHECLADVQATATELWAGRPKELTPWLEEMVVVLKEFEKGARQRVELGTLHPRNLHSVSRHRLKVEAELWKAKNAK